MSDRDPSQNPLVAWVRENQFLSALIGAMLLVVLIFAFGVLIFEGDDPELPIAVSTTQSAEALDSTPERAGPEVPQVDCRILLTDDEIDEAFFGEDAVGPRGHFLLAQGETCRYEIEDDERYIQIEPGEPADFEAEAQAGVTVESIDGLGDGARWFDDGAALGVLAVGVDLGDSSLIYRIHIGRGDLDATERLDQATELALAALPRFPGTAPEAPKPLADLCDLVTDIEAEATLDPYRGAHPATRDEIRVGDNFVDPVDLSEEGDAFCNKLILAEIYVQTQQGSPSDFEQGANMEGVAGEPVAGVGEQAVWFANVPHQSAFSAPHMRGTLAVKQGDAFFQVILAVPDTPADQQLEIVKALATSALSRLPGAPEPDKEVVSFEAEAPPETEPLALDDVLHRGIEDGAWTLKEGLVSLLQQLVEGGDGATESGSMVVLEAEAYVAANPDDGAEIEALLVQLAPDLETLPVVPGDASTGLLVSAIPLATEEPCTQDSTKPCWLAYPLDQFSDLESGKYVVYQEVPSQWTSGDVAAAIQALHDSAVKLEAIGEMPPTHLVLRADSSPYAHIKNGVCTVNLGPSAKMPDPAEFSQLTAREISFCHIGWELFDQLFESPSSARWLTWGLANYLSDYIYPTTNLELKNLPQLLALEELATTVPERRWTNWALFEYFGGFMGPDGVMDMLGSFTPGSDLVESLASHGSNSDLYHGMERALTDGEILDSSGTKASYQPQAWELLLTGPKELPMTVPQFGVRRVHLRVNPGEYGCLTTFSQGDVRLSWRPGAPGEPGDWQPDLPDTLEGESVLLLTAVQPGANFTLDVYDIADNPDCEEDDDEPDSSSFLDPILEICNALCDPSTYYWGPLRFSN